MAPRQPTRAILALASILLCCVGYVAADDCFQLGKVAYNNEDFYHAIKWFDQSLRRHDSEQSQTTQRHVLLDYLSFSLYMVGMP